VSDPSTILRRLDAWARDDRPSYEQAFVDLCLPTLLAPFVRLALLCWRPLAAGDLAQQPWYRQLTSAAASLAGELAAADGAAGGEIAAGGRGEERAASDRAMLARRGALPARLACDLALPLLKHAVTHSWDVFSLRQTRQLVAAVGSAADEAKALAAASALGWQMSSAGATQQEPEAAEAAEAAAGAVKELVMQVARKLDEAADACCVPLCVGGDGAEAAAAAAAARRQLWRALKLAAVMGEWSGLLASGPLQELLGGLIAGRVLPYLRTSLAAGQEEPVIAACEAAARAIPADWRQRDASGAFPLCTLSLAAFVAGECAPRVDVERVAPLRQSLGC